MINGLPVTSDFPGLENDSNLWVHIHGTTTRSASDKKKACVEDDRLLVEDIS